MAKIQESKKKVFTQLFVSGNEKVNELNLNYHTNLEHNPSISNLIIDPH